MVIKRKKNTHEEVVISCIFCIFIFIKSRIISRKKLPVCIKMNMTKYIILHFVVCVDEFNLNIIYVAMTTKYEYSAQSLNRSLSEHIWVICRQRPRGQDAHSRDVIARRGERKWRHGAVGLRGCRRQLFLVVAPQRSGTHSCFHSSRLACNRKIRRVTLLTHENTPVTR